MNEIKEQTVVYLKQNLNLLAVLKVLTKFSSGINSFWE